MRAVFGRTEEGASHVLDHDPDLFPVGAKWALALCGRGGTRRDGAWEEVWEPEDEPECANCRRIVGGAVIVLEGVE